MSLMNMISLQEKCFIIFLSAITMHKQDTLGYRIELTVHLPSSQQQLSKVMLCQFVIKLVISIKILGIKVCFAKVLFLNPRQLDTLTNIERSGPSCFLP